MKISIITPSLNQASYLEQTINSILIQGYKELEYIIVDGGSQDGSQAIIKKYEKHLKYWVSEKDRGQSDAINKGLRICTGDIVTWINSDDLLMPNVLSKVVNFFITHPNIDLIHGQAILFGAGKDKVIGIDQQNLDSKYLAGLAFPQPASFFRRTALERVGHLNEKLHFGMDYDLCLRLFLHGNFKAIQLKMAKYRIHPNSKTSSHSARFASDWAKIYSKLLRSLNHTDGLIDKLRELNLYVEGSETYTMTKSFSEQQIKKSFSFFLLNQVIFLYEGLNLSKTKKILLFLKHSDPSFFEKENLQKTLTRASYFPPAAMRIYRKLAI